MSLNFSFIDLLVVLVILGSAGYATWKGFVSETLSIVAWAAAAFGSLYFGPWVGGLLHGLISAPWLAMLAGYAAVFMVVFIPLSFASYRVAEGVKHSPVGPLDRVLGATFGIVRGLAILGIAYLVFTAFVPIRSQPHWLTNARTLPLIQTSSEVILALIPSHYQHDADLPDQKAQDEPKTPPGAVTPKTAKHAKKGYGVGDRRALDRLLEATGNGGSGKP
ncbi:MAG TPA: CvpA family protein [Rhizomicrobium sp.]|nr:CvpA family protein [Rhizomicrobium sp.]